MKRIPAAVKRFKKPVIVVALAIAAFLPLAFTQGNYFEITKNLEIFIALYKELNTYYVDETQPSKLIKTGIDEMLETLDPYTTYISEADIENYRLQTTGKYGGIGALIRKSDDYVIISEPYEGFPADKAGLIAGDKFVEIEGKSAKGKNTEEVSKILKGQPGTDVKVLVKRPQADGSEKDITVNITREEIKIDNIPFAGFVTPGIGYIVLGNFTEKAGKEVRDAFEALKDEDPNMKGVIFDLRGNPGGLLNEAVNVANVFIEKGTEVVSTRGKIEEWEKTFKTLNPPVDTEIPLVVLTNRGSASASEIVSGSIQDYDRGLVIGQKTFGKGLVQTTRSLPYNTKLKVTTAKYYIPSGRCIQAINYAERAEDGSVEKIPDSLKTTFQTQNGRVVYDGGGIDPDIPVEPMKYSQVTNSLVNKRLIFDYATIYKTKHDKIAEPRSFALTDQEFEDFVAHISDKEYDYTTKSEELLQDLEESSKKEKYYEAVKEELAALREDLKHDKNKDIHKNKDEIVELLEQEIVARYYYREGRIEASFDHDEDLKKAIEMLSQPAEYTAILEGAKMYHADEEGIEQN